MIQTRLELKRGPWIGERAAFWMTNHAIAVGTIVDIRDYTDPHDRTKRCLYLVVLGWPQINHVPVQQYQEIRDGIWRACSHSRGFNAAGLCFDCSLPVEAVKPTVHGGSRDLEDTVST